MNAAAFLAAAVSLAWDPSPDATHYRLHVGIQSMKAGNPPLASYPVPVPNGTTFEVTGLDYGTNYFFTATALNAAEVESGYSNEVQYTPAPPLAQTITIWPAVTKPAVDDSGKDSAVELGVEFISDVSAVVTGIRFYKSDANVGPHVANLWNAAGIRLASAAFTNETASGWQQVFFAVPVVITGGQTYVASYRCPNGHYAADLEYFPNPAANNGPLHGINSVYRYGVTSPFPTQNWRDTNYWVDVMVQP